jgi:hypothetical protein
MEATLRLKRPFSLPRYHPVEGGRALFGVASSLDRSGRVRPPRCTRVVAHSSRPLSRPFSAAYRPSRPACADPNGGCGSDCGRHNPAGMLRKSRTFVPRYRRYSTGREFSWYNTRGNGFRIDHAFLSSCLAAHAGEISYSHEERIAGLSDHSPLILELDI